MNPFNRFEHFETDQEKLDRLETINRSLQIAEEEEYACPEEYESTLDKCPSGIITSTLDLKNNLILYLKIKIKETENELMRLKLEKRKIDECQDCSNKLDDQKEILELNIKILEPILSDLKKILDAIKYNQGTHIEALYSELTDLVKKINIKDVNNDVVNTMYVKLLNICPDKYIQVNKGKNELIYNCSTCTEEEEGTMFDDKTGRCIFPPPPQKKDTPKPPPQCEEYEILGEEGKCILKEEDTKSPPKCPGNLLNPCKDNISARVSGEQEEPLDEEDIYNKSISIIENKIKSLENTNKELKEKRDCGCNAGNLDNYIYQIDEETEEEEKSPSEKLRLFNEMKKNTDMISKYESLKALLSKIDPINYNSIIYQNIVNLTKKKNFNTRLYNKTTEMIRRIIKLETESVIPQEENKPGSSLGPGLGNVPVGFEPNNQGFQLDMLTKKACISKRDNLKCNHIEAYSPLMLQGINPSTNVKYTELERNNKEKEYKNRCDIRNGDVIKCCDPNDQSLNNLYSKIPKSVKDKYPYVKLARNTETGEEVFRVCKGENCLGDGFHKPNAYELCRLSNTELKYDSDNNIASNILPNCHSSLCSLDDYTPFITDSLNQKNKQYEDYQIHTALKSDNLDSFKEL